MELTIITPAGATELLAKLPASYRPLSARIVTQLADRITEGNWEPDASHNDPIQIDLMGFIRNGRLRLMAVVEARADAQMWVTRAPAAENWQATAPTFWWTQNTLVTAIRYTGHNYEDVRDWMIFAPMGAGAIEFRGDDHSLHIGHRNIGERQSVFPGEWIARSPYGFRVYGHYEFTDCCTRMEEFAVGQRLQVTFDMTVLAITPGLYPTVALSFEGDRFYSSFVAYIPPTGAEGVSIEPGKDHNGD